MLSWRLIRRCVAALLAVALVLFGLLLSRSNGPSTNRASLSGQALSTPVPEDAPPAPEPKGPTPVVRTKETVVPNAPAGAAANVVAELPETRTTAYGMVGVTWSEKTTEQDISVAIRSLVKGQWTAWDTLDNDDAAPGDGGRPGTEPVWVGEAEGVAVRVSSASGTRPDDIRVLTIDPGGVDEPAAATVTSAAYTTNGVIDGTVHASTALTTTDGSPTYTPRPTIIMRSSWGAAAGTTCSAPLTGSSTRGIVVHHTAGSNTYAAADSAKIVRGIQAYHINGHGWCDIGYNFLVDKYGQIFEGRKGGVDRAVRAAHSGNGEVNTYTMGVSMMGDYDKVVPPEALKAAMVKLIGWRLGTTYTKAKGTYAVTENSLTLNRIAGHRNVVSTACPGRYAYAWLSATGGLRDRVEAYISQYSSAIKTRAAALGTAVTGPVFVGEAPTILEGRKTRFGKLEMYSKTGAGTHTVTADGGFRTKYASFGSQASALGFPITDSPKVTTDGTFVQRFEHGSIFAMRSGSITTLHAVWGPIATTYAAWGETTGKLGTPTSSVFAETGGSRANFRNGYIRYTTATGTTAVYSTSGAVMTASAPTADSLIIPSTRTFTLRGHGFGHGIGMSQYGAQGAAVSGVTYDKILSTYYPGTALGSRTGNIRVLISKDTTASVVVGGRSTLTFRKVGSSGVALPSTIGGVTVAQWRIMPLSSDATKSALQYKTTGSWTTYKATVWTGDAQFEASALRLFLPDGSSVVYRSILRSAIPKAGSTDRNTVNILPIDMYVRGVVSAEMPSSWMPEALKAQAVAARTYGVHGMVATRYYDMCDTTSCQVYRGVAAETTATNSAVAATAGKILTYSGVPALTQFSSSSGGWTASGGQPYLPSAADPYDTWSGNPYRSWSASVKASTLETKYPAIGTLVSIKITQRSGGGEWGGRVTSVSLVGSKATVSISGSTMRSALGLRSTWFALN